MHLELDDEVVSRVVVQELKDSYSSLKADLARYDDPNHEWIAIFDTEPEYDKILIKAHLDAFRLIIDYYGGHIDD